MGTRRKVFVSYHHGGDIGYYNKFVNIFSSTYQIVHDNSVRQPIQSVDADYVIRRIRERFLTGASVTIVLCGNNTGGRRYVDWEILASLNQQMGLIGLNLPTNRANPNGKYDVPGRLNDNIKSGYALFRNWYTITNTPQNLSPLIETALQKSKGLIVNNQPKRLRSASLR